MLANFNRLIKVVSVGALTLGVTFAPQSAQKASAQIITGAGASSVTTLLNSSSSPVLKYATSFGSPYRYIITGSGTGRTAFLNEEIDFVATDGIGLDFGAGTSVRNNTIVDASNNPVIDQFTGEPYVVINEAILNVALPYNVPGFNGQLTEQQACDIIAGNVTNWSQIPGSGSTLPIRRVVRGDNSGISAILQNGFITPVCKGLQVFDPNSGALLGIPNPSANDIIVQPPAGIVHPLNSVNDENPGSYSLGVDNTVANTPGAIGYDETAITKIAYPNFPNGLRLAGNTNNNGQTTFAVGPTYIIFRQNYFDDQTNAAAQDVCYGATFSGYLSNTTNTATSTGAGNGTLLYPQAAGFNIDVHGFQFPYFPGASAPTPPKSRFGYTTQAGTDTDNYGSLTTLPNRQFDSGPCTRIGGSINPNETISATLNTATTRGTLTFLPGAPRATEQVGDTVRITATNGTVLSGVITRLNTNANNNPTTAVISVWQSNSTTYSPNTPNDFPVSYTFNRTN